MKIILRTKCGCERLFAEGITSPTIHDIYIPLFDELSATIVPDGQAPDGQMVIVKNRRFSYYRKEHNGDLIYKERD